MSPARRKAKRTSFRSPAEATTKATSKASSKATSKATGKSVRETRAEVTAPAPRTVLVVDVGGTHIKLRATDWAEVTRIDSGPHMGPGQMVSAVRDIVGDRHYDVVAMGYPGVVKGGHPAAEPVNLGSGWVGFDFSAAFGVPVRTINDAAMQALGNYEGGHMLFIGFGTGMGSAMVTETALLPLELAHMPYRKRRTYEEYVGAAGRERMGDQKWEKHCLRVAAILRDGLQATDVVLGGGNSRRLHQLPEGMRLGAPDAAFHGGLLLWTR